MLNVSFKQASRQKYVCVQFKKAFSVRVKNTTPRFPDA